MSLFLPNSDKFKPKFSVIYPTRDRPKFIEYALRFLENQNYDNFEVIVSDNYSRYELSCEKECQKFNCAPIRYVRPQKTLNMVENWNYALEFARGDYIIYCTDKTFLLKGSLKTLSEHLKNNNPEIVSWPACSFVPSSYNDYFGEGIFSDYYVSREVDATSELYSPRGELLSKCNASKPRHDMNILDFSRGKICYGAYNKNLISRIKSRAGCVFHDISPDYTSMVLGLSYANSAVQLSKSLVVQIGTDFSNGEITARYDQRMLEFLQSLGTYPDVLNRLFIPHLYSSQHNVVAHDYNYLSAKYTLDLTLSLSSWLVHIYEDLYREDRCWSHMDVSISQKKIFEEYLFILGPAKRLTFFLLLRFRSLRRWIRQIVKAFLIKRSLRVTRSFGEHTFVRKVLRIDDVFDLPQ